VHPGRLGRAGEGRGSVEEHEPASYRKDFGFLLSVVLKCAASDVCLKPDSPPIVNIHGTKIVCKLSPLTSSDIEILALAIMDREQKADLEKYSAVVFTYEAPGLARFRISFYRRGGGVLLTARVVRDKA
jgi:twitching motility protein PilT